MTEAIPVEFLAQVPKSDLHVHLDGSLRLSTLIDLARNYRVELPSYSEDGLRSCVFLPKYRNLREYLQGFSYTTAVMQHVDALTTVAKELAEDNQRENVFYIEVRFAPQLHMHDHLNLIEVLEAVNRGLKEATANFNNQEDVKNGKKPKFYYGIICCAMRMFQSGFSHYYAQMLKTHAYAQPKEVFRLASMELCRAALIARDLHGLPIVGFDLAGEELGYPASDHHEAFTLAHKNFLKKTVHAGEAYGPESIFQAITDLHAERIGHGTYLLDPRAISDPSIVDKEQYVEQLGEYIADQRITLEICLTSNLQTNPRIVDVQQHSFKALRKRSISTTLCTDNRLVSNTTVTAELELAVRSFGMNREEIKSMIIYGFKRSFFAGNYLEKRNFVHQIIDYYQNVEKEFFP